MIDWFEKQFKDYLVKPMDNIGIAEILSSGCANIRQG